MGYSRKSQKNSSKNKHLSCIIVAFQRRYRQELIDGKIDQECLLISKKLVKKLH